MWLVAASNDGGNLGATNVLIEVEVKAWLRDPFSGLAITKAPTVELSFEEVVADPTKVSSIDLERLIS